MASAVPDIALNNGVSIPQLGFGVFQIPPEQTEDATALALQVGYRHIDTAEMYRNEAGVGAAVRASGIDRSEIFVTSKLNNGAHAYDDALAAFQETLRTLDIGYVDLFLVHWPLPTVTDFVETWKAMEEIYAGGKARAVGVSNFQTHHLNRLAAECTVVPAANQIEVHPYLTNETVRTYGAEHGIATEAWSPIAQGGVLEDPTIVTIAERLDRTPAQVTLRWHLQRGDIVFPKSVTESRVRENFALFDFELTDADLAAISALNRDERTGPDPDAFDRVP
ncbi:MAG TPA: aldo/keto reductase [Microlunatus sp.]|nr:aldo/keto reductase [Microlunatus sp.]